MSSVSVQKKPWLAIVTAALSFIVLSGCSLLEGPKPDSVVRQAPEPPKNEVVYVPDGKAEDNLPYFTKVMLDYSRGDGVVQGEPITNTLADAGFKREDMQVSQDNDPFGNAAESIYISVRFDQESLVGQIIAEGRQVIVEQLDALGKNKDQCLIVQPRG